MNAPTPNRPGASRADWRERGLQVVTRLTAALRMGRSYAIGNPTFTSQLQQLMGVLEPALAELGEVRVIESDGDVLFNELRLPVRSSATRFVDQLVHEFVTREISGVRFSRGLTIAELETFMRFFLASEAYKGGDLSRACVAQGLRNAVPLVEKLKLVRTVEEASAMPPAYRDALAIWAQVESETHALLESEEAVALRSRHFERLVAPLVDAALAGLPVSAALADLDRAPASPVGHGLRVALLAIGVGARLGLGRTALAQLGAAGVEAALGSSGQDPGEAEQPPTEAAAAVIRLLRRTPLDDVSLQAVHALIACHGVTEDVRGDAGEPLAGLLELSDAWVTLASLRLAEAPRWTSCEALGLVLGPLGGRFHPAPLAALVRVLGLYPPGQLVELDDGAVARVAAAGDDPVRPLVECMTGPSGIGAPEKPGTISELAAERRVVRAVPFVRSSAA